MKRSPLKAPQKGKSLENTPERKDEENPRGARHRTVFKKENTQKLRLSKAKPFIEGKNPCVIIFATILTKPLVSVASAASMLDTIGVARLLRIPPHFPFKVKETSNEGCYDWLWLDK